MKIGVNSWVWTSPLTTKKVETLVPKVAEMGFDWIELPIESPNDFDYGRAHNLIQAHGLSVSTCAVINEDRDLIHPNEAIRANGMGYVRHCIQAAQTMGAQNLIGPLYSAVGRTWQTTAEERKQDTNLLVKNLRELAQFAHEHGVVLCLEPLNRFETSFINTHEQAIDIIDQVDHAACGIMLDSFHMNIEEKSLGDAIRATGHRLRQLHACENDRGAPGSGNVAWNEIAQALKDINYDGPVVIESFTAEVKSIAKATAVWRSVAPSQDALAGDGLSFLRKLLS